MFGFLIAFAICFASSPLEENRKLRNANRALRTALRGLTKETSVGREWKTAAKKTESDTNKETSVGTNYGQEDLSMLRNKCSDNCLSGHSETCQCCDLHCMGDKYMYEECWDLHCMETSVGRKWKTAAKKTESDTNKEEEVGSNGDCWQESTQGVDLAPGQWTGSEGTSFEQCKSNAEAAGVLYFAWTGQIHGGYCKILNSGVTSPNLATNQGYEYNLWLNKCQKHSAEKEIGLEKANTRLLKSNKMLLHALKEISATSESEVGEPESEVGEPYDSYYYGHISLYT